jgi:hypothetical protein
MRVVSAMLAVALALIGVFFLAGHQGQVLRIVVGAVLLAGAVALVVAARLRPTVVQRQVVQRIELSGDVRLEDLTCRECRGRLSRESVQLRAGAVSVACPYCQAEYQLEEAPRW